jgi:BON domain
MSSKRFAAGVLFLVVLVAPLVAAKESDGPILLKSGKTAWERIRSSLPEKARLTGPLAAIRTGDALPPDERVRVRLQTDTLLAAIDVQVIPGDGGQITLRGVMPSTSHRTRAADIAKSTTGITGVTDEMAVPEGK